MMRDWIVKDYDWCPNCRDRVSAPEGDTLCGRCTAELEDDLIDLAGYAG